MKYKLLKKVGRFDVGHCLLKETINKNFPFEYQDNSTFTINFLFEHNREEYFEEVKEIPKPRWKCGDPVVTTSSNPRYFRIDTVQSNFDATHLYNWATESTFRDPTPEELSLYFR